MYEISVSPMKFDSIKRVREEVSIPVGIRLSLYEDDQDGYPPEHGLKIAESLKTVDYSGIFPFSYV